MPTGPNGEKRPTNPIAAGVHIARIATGEDEEQLVDMARAAGGRKGGLKRNAKMSPEERSRIAREAAEARWKRD